MTCSLYYSGVVVVLIWNLLLLHSFPLSDQQEGQQFSGSLCPKKRPGDPNKVYYNETKQCYKEFSKGPCPNNMVIMQFFPNGDIGECDCSLDGNLPYVYNPQRDECFQLYKQSYCAEGMWLVPNKRQEPVCRKNPCLKEMSDDEEEPTVWFKGSCVKYFNKSPLCPTPNDLIQFPRDSLKPECVPQNPINGHSITSVKRLSCRPGSRRDVTGNCVPEVVFIVDEDEP